MIDNIDDIDDEEDDEAPLVPSRSLSILGNEQALVSTSNASALLFLSSFSSPSPSLETLIVLSCQKFLRERPSLYRSLLFFFVNR